MLLEVREQYHRQVSVFSGKEFNVDAEQRLSGYCDFLVSASPVQTVITAPVLIVAESKRGELELGFGQCVAGMIGAQQFNQRSAIAPQVSTIYGTTTNGTLWRFFKLEGTTLTIDLTEYAIPPVNYVLGVLYMMLQKPSSIVGH